MVLHNNIRLIKDYVGPPQRLNNYIHRAGGKFQQLCQSPSTFGSTCIWADRLPQLSADDCRELPLRMGLVCLPLLFKETRLQIVTPSDNLYNMYSHFVRGHGQLVGRQVYSILWHQIHIFQTSSWSIRIILSQTN